MRRRFTWSDEQLELAIKSSISIAQVIRALGMRVAGGNYETIKRRVKDLGLDTAHWLGQAHYRGKVLHRPSRALEDILRSGTRYQTRTLKLRLLRAGMMDAACKCCGLTEWMGKSIPLELDHIDGDRENNSLSNLRLLCPNCHALTPTYRGRNTRYAHIPPLPEIYRGIEEAGGLAQYAVKIGVSKDAVRNWLKSERLRRFSRVEEAGAGYWH